MTINELESLITNTDLFTSLGKLRSDDLVAAYRDVTDDDNWDWLPTTHNQTDPIHGRSLIKIADERGIDELRKRTEMKMAKLCMISLRAVPEKHPQLVDGPHNLTPAPKGAAVFATRMCAREIVTDTRGTWCSILHYYALGYWPCGRYPHGRLVVY